ncbi:unnamed protein product [Rotaria socialis]|uniref:G domain-containing protein n=1 Tax=Rotaria socialis TaxID=392032 RepID=A0A817QEK6_9BILA|nr:unnamed protein product [Rotaria socialis]CAF3326772.1 unnamed protein product [Rotaria socialis]CAF4355914.1 unnamed protein product [Rotaria socialis]CAF4473697.1 unnamed protein product [Rotaria socialis]
MSTVNLKRFILLGEAGAGKSTFINFLYNFCYGSRNSDKIFCEDPHVRLAIPCANWLDCLDKEYKDNRSERDINDQTQSQTQFCSVYRLKSEKIDLELIDTPGFNDTNGTETDLNNLAHIERTLHKVPFLSGIILVVNGANPRIGVSFNNFLHLLQQVWPNDLLNNCVAILTNCDELSVSFNPSVLKQIFNVQDKSIFVFQNTLFRWDRKMESSKTIRRHVQHFQDNVEKVDVLFKKLLTYKDVSTQSFKVSAIKIGSIEQSIIQSVREMIDLVKCYKEQSIAHDAIEGTRTTMDMNKNWEKKQEIHAIVFEEVPQNQARSSYHERSHYSNDYSDTQKKTTSVETHSRRDTNYKPQTSSYSSNYGSGDYQRMTSSESDVRNGRQVSSSYNDIPVANNRSSSIGQNTSQQPNIQQTTMKNRDEYKKTAKVYEPVYQQKQAVIEINLPDNEARMRYTEAERQKTMLKRRKNGLEAEQTMLSTKINSHLDNLRKQVAELWSINRNYDILDRNKGLLEQFAEIMKFMGDNSDMQRYYDETVRILTKNT